MRIRCEFCGSSKLKIYPFEDLFGEVSASTTGYCEHSGKSMTYTVKLTPKKNRKFLLVKCSACKHLQIIEQEV